MSIDSSENFNFDDIPSHPVVFLPEDAEDANLICKWLAQQGYNPVPIPIREKGSRLTGWNTGRCAAPSDEEIDSWKDEPNWTDYWTNVGILCGTPSRTGDIVIAIDIDVYDREVADELTDLAWEMLGESYSARQGLRPKIALLYRTDESYTLPTTAKYDGKHQVEMRGQGQLLALYGIHPDHTEESTVVYTWMCDEHPCTTPASKLLLVTKDQVRAFLTAADNLLKKRFPPSEKPSSTEKPEQPSSKPDPTWSAASPETIRSALAAIPNTDLDRKPPPRAAFS
jgi:hypothetical protein